MRSILRELSTFHQMSLEAAAITRITFSIQLPLSEELAYELISTGIIIIKTKKREELLRESILLQNCRFPCWPVAAMLIMRMIQLILTLLIQITMRQLASCKCIQSPPLRMKRINYNRVSSGEKPISNQQSFIIQFLNRKSTMER